MPLQNQNKIVWRKLHCYAFHEVQSSVRDGKDLFNSRELVIGDNTEQDVLIQIQAAFYFSMYIEWKIIKSVQ